MKNEIAVLVVSCDKYKDTWLPFFDLLSNHWRGLDINVYLGNNFENFTYIVNNRNVKVINIGTDLAWTNNYIKMFSTHPKDFILSFYWFFCCSMITTCPYSSTLFCGHCKMEIQSKNN